MAALRQLLSTREMQGSLYPRALPEESRQMVKAKMEAIGSPISPQPPAVPEKEQSSKNSDYDTGLSLKPVKYQESTQPKYETDSHNYDRDTYTSMYEQRLSQDLSPALNNHLAHRTRNPPRNNSETNISSTIYEHRRRSRSAAEEAYDSNAWSDRKNNAQGRRPPPRGDSRSTSQPPRHYREASEPIPEMHEYTMSPVMDNGAFQPLAKIGHDNKKQNPYNHYNDNTRTGDSHSGSINNTKHSTHDKNDASTDPSPSNSIREGVKHTPPATDQHAAESSRNKRPHPDDELDYPTDQLASKSYSDLASEPFDHNPPSFFAQNTALIKRLPSTTLPLPSRLQAVFDTPTPTTSTTKNNPNQRTALAKTLFASLTIDKYEECGDILLEKFADVMKRMKEARQVKRKACRAMEEEVALREGWVRRKRVCVEEGLGRLKTTGMSVVNRPVARVAVGAGGGGGGGGGGW